MLRRGCSRTQLLYLLAERGLNVVEDEDPVGVYTVAPDSGSYRQLVHVPDQNVHPSLSVIVLSSENAEVASQPGLVLVLNVNYAWSGL